MDKNSLSSGLDAAISQYKKDFESLQKNHAYCSEEVQSAVNALGSITLEALQNFKAVIIQNCD